MEKLASGDWGAFIFYLIATLVGVLVGYLSSYARKKAENLATKEDFDVLLNQVKKTTEETELIKQSLSSDAWLNQQRWQLKERFYLDLLENLFKFRITLLERLDYFIEPGSEHDEKCTKTEHFKMQQHLGNEAYETVIRLWGSAAIVLPDEANDVLEALRSGCWNTKEFSNNTADYLNSTVTLVDKAYLDLLRHARMELVGPTSS